MIRRIGKLFIFDFRGGETAEDGRAFVTAGHFSGKDREWRRKEKNSVTRAENRDSELEKDALCKQVRDDHRALYISEPGKFSLGF